VVGGVSGVAATLYIEKEIVEMVKFGAAWMKEKRDAQRERYREEGRTEGREEGRTEEAQRILDRLSQVLEFLPEEDRERIIREMKNGHTNGNL
jgi:predicted transposase YdaD